MLIRFRTIHSQVEDFCIVPPGEDPPIPFSAVTSAEICGCDVLDRLNVKVMFRLVGLMPRLQDLTINFDDVEPVPRRQFIIHEFPFRLRRLVISPIFPGAQLLINDASDTLECLALGPPYDPRVSTFDLVGDLSGLRNLRALRMDTEPGALAHRHLNALALRGSVAAVGNVRHQLARLTIICHRFDDNMALALAAAVPGLASLRTLEIEVDAGNEFTLACGAGKQALSDACRALRVSVSVMRTRHPGAW